MERTQTRSSAPGLVWRAGVALAVAALVAACGPSGATTAPPTKVPTAAPPATMGPATAGPTTAATGLTLELTEATVGDHVTGEGGMALYIFTPDADAPGRSECNGDCASSWPPLAVDDISQVTAGAGVTGTLGVITRDDGATQVTLGGNPLYYFAGDSATGQTNGQGLNDVWWLAGADGKGVGAPAGGGGRDY